MSAEFATGYDEASRQGWCSCGAWRCYAVSAVEYERMARRHMAVHAERARRATEARDQLDAEARAAEHRGDGGFFGYVPVPGADEMLESAEAILREGGQG